MESKVGMKSNSKKLIVIGGPTASGKTELGIELAMLLDSEIISADSRQVFKYLDVGTAKPTSEERSQAVHHFIDFLEPDDYYSAGVFGDQAYAKVQELQSNGIIPIVVGGSGLYIKALCEGFFKDHNSNSDNSIRIKLESELNELGLDNLYDRLKEIDPKSADLYIEKNPRRIIRALEYFEITGIPFSQAHQLFDTKRELEPLYFGIFHDRNLLYNRINIRSEIMWKSGIIEETEKVLSMGFSKELNSLNTVGYKETIAFLEGKISEYEAIEKISQNTRRYAKRQMTWFRQYDDMTWLSGSPKECAKKIYEQILD